MMSIPAVREKKKIEKKKKKGCHVDEPKWNNEKQKLDEEQARSGNREAKEGVQQS